MADSQRSFAAPGAPICRSEAATSMRLRQRLNNARRYRTDAASSEGFHLHRPCSVRATMNALCT